MKLTKEEKKEFIKIFNDHNMGDVADWLIETGCRAKRFLRKKRGW